MQQNQLIVVAIRRLLYLNLKNHYGNIKVQTRFNLFSCFGHISQKMSFWQPVSDVSKCNIYAVYVSVTCRINLTLSLVCIQEVICKLDHEQIMLYCGAQILNWCYTPIFLF